jgi:hypothetical protein
LIAKNQSGLSEQKSRRAPALGGSPRPNNKVVMSADVGNRRLRRHRKAANVV